MNKIQKNNKKETYANWQLNVNLSGSLRRSWSHCRCRWWSPNLKSEPRQSLQMKRDICMFGVKGKQRDCKQAKYSAISIFQLNASNVPHHDWKPWQLAIMLSRFCSYTHLHRDTVITDADEAICWSIYPYYLLERYSHLKLKSSNAPKGLTIQLYGYEVEVIARANLKLGLKRR